MDNNNRLRAIAEDAIMTLEQHDRVYHDGNYTGGFCEYRKTREKGDTSDDALNEADRKEYAYFSALAAEKDSINKAFKKMLAKGLKAKKGSTTVTVGDQQRDGIREVHVWTDPNVDADAFEKASIPLAKGLGYKVREIAAIETQDPEDHRKIFAVKLFNPNQIGTFAEQKQDAPAVVEINPDKVSDSTLRALRRRYGIARGNDGEARGLTEEEKNDKTASERYLDLVGAGEFAFGGTREGQERERAFRAGMEEVDDSEKMSPEEVRDMLKWIHSRSSNNTKKADARKKEAKTTSPADEQAAVEKAAAEAERKARIEKAFSEWLALPFGQRYAAKLKWPEDIAKDLDAKAKKFYKEQNGI